MVFDPHAASEQHPDESMTAAALRHAQAVDRLLDDYRALARLDIRIDLMRDHLDAILYYLEQMVREDPEPDTTVSEATVQRAARETGLEA